MASSCNKNGRKHKKCLVVGQIVPVCTMMIGSAYGTVRRTCILMLGCKGLIYNKNLPSGGFELFVLKTLVISLLLFFFSFLGDI